MFCPNCGTEFEEGVNFCPKCGTKRPQSALATENGPNQPKSLSQAADTPAAVPKSVSLPSDTLPINSENVAPHKKKRKLPLILGALGAIIVILILLVTFFGNEDSPEITTVKNGYLGEFTDMTVEEILDGYYSGLLGYEEGTWDSGITDDGTTIVQIDYVNEMLGNITIQFSMLDEDCFKATAFVDPLEDVESVTDLLAALNKFYVLSYEVQYPEAERANVEKELLERLNSINATSVRYGASKDYTGDRAQLYQMFGDSQLEMSVVELLEAYGIIDTGIYVEDTPSSIPDEETVGYSAGSHCAEDIFTNIGTNGSNSLTVGILYNEKSTDLIVNGFCDTAITFGVNVNNILTYSDNNSTDFTPELFQFQESGVDLIFFIEPDLNKSEEIGELLMLQSDTIGFYPSIYDFNSGYVEQQQERSSSNTFSDFASIEGTYHMAHNYTLQMGLWFESDMTGTNSSNWQSSEPLELHFQFNDSNEILGDGVAYWWPLSDGAPLFEGELYSSLDPITIEYDGSNFIVSCSALGLQEASFFKD